MKHFILLFCLLLSGLGCSRPHIGRIDSSSVILAVGDSLTFGIGAEPSQSYPSLLSEMMGCRVVNAGVSGELSAAGLQRLPELLDQYHPNLMILCHGGNDLLAKQDESLIEANLDAMLKLAKEREVDVILIGVPKPGLLLRAPGFYQNLATRHKIPCDSKTIPKILSSPSLKSDYVHPNAAGYQRMAEVIAELIRKSQG
jgi:lysophospholipase L1-like esterase